MQSLCDDLELVTSSDDINTSVSNFVNHIDSICKSLFGKRNVTPGSKRNVTPGSKRNVTPGSKRNVTPGSKSTSTSVYKHSFTNDSTYENKRKEYYILFNIYRLNKTVEIKIQMINARKHYKNSVRHFNFECSKRRTDSLLQAKYKNTKSYWKILKDSVSNNQRKDITFNAFTEYFKSVNNPDDHFSQPDEDIEYLNQRFLNRELNVMFAELDVAFTSSELDTALSELSLS